MRKILVIGIMLLVCSVAAFAAPPKEGNLAESFGILFGIKSFDIPLSSFSDSVLPGVCGGYRFTPELAVRVLISANYKYNSASETAVTWLGGSAGLEYHFITRLVSPYTGVFVGINFLIDNTGMYADYHGGAMPGVELNVLDYLSFSLNMT